MFKCMGNLFLFGALITKRMVIDYRSLNKQTIKNNYPLPLITDLIDNMGDKRVFTKIDLWWGFNNIRIKEGNK